MFDNMKIDYCVQYQDAHDRWIAHKMFDTYKEAKDEADLLNKFIDSNGDPNRMTDNPYKFCRIIQILIMEHEIEY